MGAGRCGDGERGWHTTEPDEESRSSFASYTPLSPLSTFRSLAFGSFHFTSWEDWEAWANVRSERPKGTSDKGSGTDKERREREVKGVRKRVRDGTADNMTRHDPRPGTTLVTSAVRRVVTPLRALHSLPIPSVPRHSYRPLVPRLLTSFLVPTVWRVEEGSEGERGRTERNRQGNRRPGNHIQ